MLKVQSRCNLDCAYCYVYHLADSSWRSQPKRMAPDVVRATVARIAEHARAHDLKRVAISLHGGEPLLGGVEYVESVVGLVREGLGGLPADVLLQTNGVLLTAPVADRLIDAGVRIGVSLDGDRAANDLNRTYVDGRSSYDAVVAAIDLLSADERRDNFAGILCTIQIAAPPLDVWRSFLALNPPAVDFLLPHATRSDPPPANQYAKWLIPLFDDWFDAPAQPVRVRMFEDLLDLVLGGTGGYEGFGLRPFPAAIIESDGTFELVDSLKAAFDGATRTGLDVFRHSVDDYLRQPGVIARQIGRAALADTCLACDVVDVCGGGMYAHRYRAGTGFRNPSVYCADLLTLIRHVEERVSAGLRARGTTLAQVRGGHP